MKTIERGKSTTSEGLAQLVLKLTEQGIESSDNCAEACCVAASAGIAAVTALSILTGKGDGPDESCTKESMIFSAMLVASTFRMTECPHHPGQNHNVAIDYGPHTMLRAMEMYEKVMGEKPDAYLNPPLVEQTREYEKQTPPAKRVNPFVPADEQHHGLLH
jgi:hypothetical protein